MVSKLEILAYYISLAVDLNVIISVGVAASSVEPGSDAANPALEGLGVIGLGFSVALFLMDLATLKSYYLEDTGQVANTGKDSSGFESLQTASYQYIATSTVELYLLIALISLFGATLGTTTATGGQDLNITLLVLDYVMVCFRATAKLFSLSQTEYFNPRTFRGTDTSYPFSLLLFAFVSIWDMLEGLCYLPLSICWSLKTLRDEKWLPDFIEGGDFCAPVTNLVQNLT